MLRCLECVVRWYRIVPPVIINKLKFHVKNEPIFMLGTRQNMRKMKLWVEKKMVKTFRWPPKNIQL